MKQQVISRLYVALSCMLFLFSTKAYGQPGSAVPVLRQLILEKGLFDTEEVLEITLKGNIREGLNDRSGIPKNYPMVLAYTKEDGKELTFPVEVRTRGHFRRLKENCTYPPL